MTTLTLGFDTSSAHVGAALFDGTQIIASAHEEMARGQAERLMPLLEEVLAEAGKTWADLDRIGVGIGPGNFTGIRISVSAARGLALGLGIPAVGVSTFEAIALDMQGKTPAVSGPRGQAYLAPEDRAPYLAAPDEVEALTASDALVFATPPLLAQQIARAASARPDPSPRPAPLYIKPADAAPSRDAPPVILDDA
jgi:tRNA threonylcarbamoyl adenosine modification protein YeaZ